MQHAFLCSSRCHLTSVWHCCGLLEALPAVCNTTRCSGTAPTEDQSWATPRRLKLWERQAATERPDSLPQTLTVSRNLQHPLLPNTWRYVLSLVAADGTEQ